MKATRRFDELLAWTLLLGLPVALWLCTGSPFELLGSFGQPVASVAALVWVVWVWCGLDVVISTISQLHRRELLRDAPRTIDRIAARIAGLAMVAVTVLPAFSGVAGASAAPHIAPSPRAVASATVSSPASQVQRRYQVQQGDCLWRIAQHLYGDPLDWTFIAEANLGHAMADGRIFQNPSLIYVGWTLTIPPLSAPPSVSDGTIRARSLLPIHTHAPHREDPAQLAPSEATAPAPSNRDAHHSIPASWWLPSGIASSALLVGLLARKRRLSGDVLDDDALLDAASIVNRYPAEPLVSLLERAILLAWRDGVLTDPAILTLCLDRAELRVAGTITWTALAADLAAPYVAPTTSPGFVLVLSERPDTTQVLIVPPGTSFTIQGSAAKQFLSDSLLLQKAFLWGVMNHLEASEMDRDIDQVVLATEPNPDPRAACVIIVDKDADCNLDEYRALSDELDDEASPLAMFDALGHALVEAPSLPAPTPAPMAPSSIPEQGGPVLKLLAPEPRIDGLSQAIESSRRRRVLELIAYLCLHRDDPPTADRLRTRVLGTMHHDAAAKTLFNITSAARRALGTARDGSLYLPSVTRDGRYLISDHVVSDLEYFLAWTASSDSDDEVRLEELRRAFNLIEGEPLSATLNGYHWLSAEGFRAGLEIRIERAAREGVALALQNGDRDLAETMVAKARCVARYSEELCVLAMHVAAAQQSETGIRSAFDALAGVRDQLDPGSEPDAHQEQIYRGLLERVRGDQASLAAIEAAPRSTRPSAPSAL